ncbi:sulfite exporter TauE/SafE family protein [Paenibacillus thermotolerans]|uniref:sulfite exporter TauE/SafE family protein n=1 Tax=Paenibacillus thermotolerans TaxID=3027807 RepID=UPI002368E4BD|nr:MULTISPECIES: sulfite exporter TauE/SafE family protein [unclassified Paenibacillus]
MDMTIAIIGLIVGFLVGLTGVGGAALLTPILIYIGINPSIAVGTDLFYNSVTKLFGTVQHWRQKTIQWKLVSYLASGSVPGAVAAVALLKAFEVFFDSQEDLIRSSLGIMLVIVAASILARQYLFKEAKENKWQAKPIEEKRLLTVVIGFVLGFIVGLTSIGSGSLFALALIYFFRLPAARIVGTDIAHAFFLVAAAGLMHAGIGNVDFPLALNLLAGSVPGVLIGSKLSTRAPSKPLRTAVAVLILISGAKLL